MHTAYTVRHRFNNPFHHSLKDPVHAGFSEIEKQRSKSELKGKLLGAGVTDEIQKVTSLSLLRAAKVELFPRMRQRDRLFQRAPGSGAASLPGTTYCTVCPEMWRHSQIAKQPD